MKDKDRQVLPSLNGDADLPERLWLYDDFNPGEDAPVTDFATGLASLGFIGAAVRRSRRLWCVLAIVGFLCGVAYYVMSPASYEATATILLTHNPDENPIDAMQTDLDLAHSGAVAGQALRKLGLNESSSSFLATYTVINPTDRVMQLTVSAPSSSAAVLRANTLATQFLQWRADRLQTQLQLTTASLDQQIAQARQHIASLAAQIQQVSAQPASPERQAKLSQLTTQHSDAVTAVTILQQTTDGNEASGQAALTAEVQGSQVLDPAVAMHHSSAKFALIYALIGLILGLVLGLAIVIIRALLSSRLRRRDDVADALGTPVSLSTGSLDEPRWLPGRPRANAARAHDLQRIVTNLRDAARKNSPGTIAALAVVSVDNDKTAARSLASLALSCAKEGEQVILADLCPGAPAAHLLGIREPGVHTVTVDGASLTVLVPRGEDVVPAGPFRHARLRVTDASPDETLTAAYNSADILLTLANLDPSFGAEHLRTWATEAAVIMTAGRSSWMRIHAVGELIRLARLPLVSAILVDVDKTDESLGFALTDPAIDGTARTRGL